MDNDANKSNKMISIIIGAIVLLLLIGLLIWAFNDDDDVSNNTTYQNDDNGIVVDEKESTLTELTDNPESFIGQNVTLTAEVQDVLTNRIVKVSNDVIGDEVTVVTPKALSGQQAEQAEEFLQDNANVRVEGIVRRATVAEFERDYNLTLDPTIEAEFADTIVLVADSITFIDQSDVFWEFNLFSDEKSE